MFPKILVSLVSLSAPFFSVPLLSLFITCKFPAAFCAFLASQTWQSEVCMLSQFSYSSTKGAISPLFQRVLHLTVLWKPKLKRHNKYSQKQAPDLSLPWTFSIFSTCNFFTWNSSAKFQDGVSKKWLKITIIISSYINNVFFLPHITFWTFIMYFWQQIKF